MKPKKPKKLTRKQQHAALLKANRHRYDDLLAAQGGVCALCLRLPNQNRKFDLDHDHARMVIRGVLCFLCNKTLASWITPDWLDRAKKYIAQK